MTTLTFLGDGVGHFRPGAPLPSNAVKSYSVNLADMTKSGHLDIVLRNDSPDPNIRGNGNNDIIFPCRDACQSFVYFNDGHGNFEHSEPWGPDKGSIRAMAVADLDGDGHLDIAACPERLGFVYLVIAKATLAAVPNFRSRRRCRIP